MYGIARRKGKGQDHRQIKKWYTDGQLCLSFFSAGHNDSLHEHTL